MTKVVPPTPNSWCAFVAAVKELTDMQLNADDYSLMMRQYYILGKKPEDFVNKDK